MSKIELDDQILDHPKFVRAVKLGGSDIVFLWLGLRSYCSKLLTDGFVPDDMLDEVRGPKEPRKRASAMAALKEVKLVDECDGGVRLHDYLDWASSREDVLRWRARARERQAKSRGMSQRDSERDTPSDNKCDDSGSHEPRVRARVAPTSPSPSPSQSPSGRREDRFAASMAGTGPGTRKDVLELHSAWRTAFGRTGATLRHATGDDAYALAEAIDAHGMPDCLLVAAEAPRDGWVSGQLDDKNAKHESIRYIFGTEETFSRILAAAKKRGTGPNGGPKKPYAQQHAEHLQKGRLLDE